MRAKAVVGWTLSFALPVGGAWAGPPDQLVVNVEHAAPGRTVEVDAPAFRGAAVTATADATGKLQVLLTVANAGKHVAVRLEQCAEGGERISIALPGSGDRCEGGKTPRGCTCREGTPFLLDTGASALGATRLVTIDRATLEASVSQLPPSRTVIRVKDAQGAAIEGVRITLTPSAPGRAAQTATTNGEGSAKFELAPGSYRYRIDAERFESSDGERTIAPGDQAIEIPLAIAAMGRERVIVTSLPGVGDLGTFWGGFDVANQSFGELAMTASRDAIRDEFNGALVGSSQNAASVATQNELFDFRLTNDDAAGVVFQAGLGEVKLGERGKLSFGAGVSLRSVTAVASYDLQRTATGFRSSDFEASGESVGFEGTLQGYVVEDRLWFFVKANVGTAGLEEGRRIPPIDPGAGARVLEDQARLDVDTFSLGGGVGFSFDRAYLMLGASRTAVDLTVEGSGALVADLPQGTLRRSFEFANSFSKSSVQAVAGVGVRLWRQLHLDASLALGGNADSVRFGLLWKHGKRN